MEEGSEERQWVEGTIVFVDVLDREEEDDDEDEQDGDGEQDRGEVEEIGDGIALNG